MEVAEITGIGEDEGVGEEVGGVEMEVFVVVEGGVEEEVGEGEEEEEEDQEDQEDQEDSQTTLQVMEIGFVLTLRRYLDSDIILSVEVMMSCTNFVLISVWLFFWKTFFLMTIMHKNERC